MLYNSCKHWGQALIPTASLTFLRFSFFKIDIKSKSKIINCCNGGRYDKLISDLGSKKQTPAVGAALNLVN